MAAALLVLPLLVHAGSVGHPFLIDDHTAIAEHPQVTRFNGLFELWASDYWAGQTEDRNLYRPITVLSYWANWRVTPNHAAGFRVVNLLLLGGIGVGLFALLRRHTGVLAAALAAGLYVVHPVHGEVVNHLVGRADLLAVLGIIGFLAVQGKALERGWSRRGIALAGLFTVVALGSKESGYALLPLAGLQWWMSRKKGVRNLFVAGCDGEAKKVPDTFASEPNACGTHLGICRKRALLFALLIPGAVLIAVRLLVVGVGADYTPGSDDLTGNPLRQMGFAERLPEACGGFFWYLKQLVWPALTFNHTPPPGAVGGWSFAKVIGGLLLIDCVVGVLWLALSRKRRVIVLAPALLLFHFLIVGNLLLPTGVYAANRLTVASTAAGAIALGYALSWLMRRGYKAKLATLIATGCAALVAALVTFSHADDWSSELARMEADAAAQPENPIALYWLGQAQLQAEQPGAALPVLTKAHALAPKSRQAALSLANAAVFAGDDRRAWALYQQLLTGAVPLKDTDRLNAAMAAYNVGQYEQAERLARSLPGDMGRPVLEALEQVGDEQENQP